MSIFGWHVNHCCPLQCKKMLDGQNNNRNIILLNIMYIFFKHHCSIQEYWQRQLDNDNITTSGLLFCNFILNKFKAIRLKGYNLLIKTKANIQFAVCTGVCGQIQIYSNGYKGNFRTAFSYSI